MTSAKISTFLDQLRAIKKQIALWSFNNSSSASKYNFSVCDIRGNFIKLLNELEEEFGRQLPANVAPSYFFDRHGGELGVSDSAESRQLVRDISEEIDKLVVFLENYVNQAQNDYVIFKGVNDDYYYRGAVVTIKNKTALYYIIFDIIYNKAPKGGEVPFQTILDELKNKGWDNCNNKTIYNQFSASQKAKQGFFRYVKQIKNIADEGKPLIEFTGKSKSVKFNNQKFR
jgi:hypothetical protein